jgi:hypothetical protein
MKCFNHRELDAIAVCKHCGRAMCADCASEIEGMIACRNRCETAVTARNRFFQACKHNLAAQAHVFCWLAYVAYGGAMVMCALADYEIVVRGVNPPEVMVMAFGVGLIVAGICSQRHGRLIQSQL